MPENPPLPKPEQILGGGSKKLPSPDQVLNAAPAQYSNPAFDYLNTEDGLSQAYSKIDSIPDLYDGQREVLKNLVKRGGTKEDISTTLGALQSGDKFYMNERGVAIRLKPNERPPKEYDVASMWGTQEEADDDNGFTTVAKQIYNILPSLAENAIDLVHLPYGAIAGKEADWYNKLKNSADYLKLNTSSASKEMPLDVSKVHDFSDIFKGDNWDFTPDNVAGTIGQVVKSVGEFMGGGYALATATGVTKASSLAKKVGTAFTGSYMTQVGEGIKEGLDAGLDVKDAYKTSAAVTIPVAMVDLFAGAEGKILREFFFKPEAREFSKNVIKGLAQTMKKEGGKLTAEELDKAFKLTLQSAASLTKDAAMTSLSEAGQEAGQAFIEKAGHQIYDHFSDADKAKFGGDAFGPKATAEYVNEAIAGLFGGAVAGGGINKLKAINKDNNQSKTAFGLVQPRAGETLEQANDRINSYKANIQNEVRNGKLSKEEGDAAITRINSYKEYNEITSSLELDPAKKREVFDKTFQKQNLESEMEGMGDPAKLNALRLAEYQAKEKLAKDLQKDISEATLEAMLKREKVVGKKTIEEQAKKRQKAEEAALPKTPEQRAKEPKFTKEQRTIIDKYKKDKAPETRPLTDIDNTEFNEERLGKATLDHRTRHDVVAKWLKGLPNQTTEALLQLNEFKDKKGDTNTTVYAKFPGGKRIRFSSSMFRDEKFRGHFQQEHSKGMPIGVTLKTLKTGKPVIKAFDATTGRFIGWAKATNTGGKSGKVNFTKEEQEELENLQMRDKDEPPIGGSPIAPSQSPGPAPVNPSPVSSKTKEEKAKQALKELMAATGDEIFIMATEDGTFAGQGLLNIDEDGNIILTRHTKNKEDFVKSGQITTPEDMKRLTGVFGGEQVATSGVAGGAASFKSEFEGQYVIPLNELIKLIKEGYVTFAGIGNKEFVLSPHIAKKYLSTVNGQSVTQPLTGNNVQPEINTPQIQNGTEQQPAPEGAAIGAQPVTGNLEEGTGQDQQEGDARPQIATKRQGTPRSQQKIVNPARIKALEYEVYHPEHQAMQYFIGKGFLTPESLKKHVFGKEEGDPNDGEVRARNYILTEEKGGKSIPEIAHAIWGSETTQDKEDAVIRVVLDYNYKGDMAQDLIKVMEEGDERQQMNAWLGFNPEEEAINEATRKLPAEAEEVFEEVVSELEFLDDESIQELADEQGLFDEWYDAIRSGSKEKFVEVQKKQLQSREDAQYDPANNKVYNTIFGKQYDAYLRGDFSGYYQKESTKTKTGDVQKVVEAMQKSMPKVKIVYDPTLKAAGKKQGNTILINPYRAGKDTPIHEAGHVLIDAIGYDNKVIQAAIKQLKDTDLWKETAAKYEELSERELGIEVLAEAIGREGADIFDTEQQKSSFKTFLDYIFDWLKRNLGLEKNVAKNLARQIIQGHGTKEMTGKDTEYQQKASSKFNEYRRNVLSRDIEEEKADLAELKRALKEDDLSSEEADEIESAIEGIYQRREEDRADFEENEVISQTMAEIAESEDLSEFTLDELIEVYNEIEAKKNKFDQKVKDKAKLRIANFIQNREIERLSKVKPDIEDFANSTDMTWGQKWFKTLSDVSEQFPMLQGLSREFDKRFLKKMQDTVTLKKKHEKLGKAVIREANKSIFGIASDVFRTDSAKYFEFVEDNEVLRTDTTGLTKAQKDYLEFITDLVKDRNTLTDEDNNIIDNTLIRMDKKFGETRRTEGILAALSYQMSGNIPSDTEIEYTDPLIGNKKKGTYYDAQQEIIAYGKKGNFFSALWKLFNLARTAKKSDGQLNYRGALTSKFDRVQPKGKGWSKDYYRAAMAFIDDKAHVENMADLVPIVQSIDKLYEVMGMGEKHQFNNTRQFINEWFQEQVYQKEKVTDPTLDTMFRLLRGLTSKMVMAFNVPANLMNIAMGNYNNLRAETAGMWATGNIRFFGNMRKANAILKHFDVVNPDFDSNPKIGASKLFDNLAYAGNRYGELQIQGSMFLGQLSDTEWKNMSVDKDGEVVFNNVADQEAFNEKMIQYRNRVTDIQGKYPGKDRRNFMRFEAGRAAAQFKVWIPDYLKERIGKEFIDKNNIRRHGSWRVFTGEAFKELKADIDKYGYTKALWNNKAVMANIKGLMVTATLMIAAHSDDDDEEIRRKTLSVENGLSQMLFIVDPHQALYLLESPVAGIGTLKKFVDATQALMDADVEKFEKNAKKLVPYNKLADLVPEED